MRCPPPRGCRPRGAAAGVLTGGATALADNRSTQHYATCDYDHVSYPRRMHRVTVVNDRLGEAMAERKVKKVKPCSER